MPSPKAEEKRGSPRYPLERLAKIKLGQGNPPRYCRITDISGRGVRVNTFGFDLPDEFVLLLSGDGPAEDGTYRVIWRLGQDVGAKFVSRETPIECGLAKPLGEADRESKPALGPRTPSKSKPRRHR